MTTIAQEIKLAQIESEIKIVRQMITALEELNEVKYISSYAFKQGILRAKADLCDLMIKKQDCLHAINLILNN